MRILALTVLATLAFTSLAAHAGDRIEISVDSVFTPQSGWDDNDSVHAVVYGRLPNGCYQLAESQVETKGGREFRIHQFAIKVANGPCADETKLPVTMRLPVVFTKEVEIGTLQKGSYRLSYSGVAGAPASKWFQVAEAQALTIDSLPYANVTQQHAPDLLIGSEHLKVTLFGVLGSPCVELDENMSILKQADAFILLPVVRETAAAQCEPMLRPFEKEIDLGPQAPGNYLIHVRSQNGKAVNHVVKVIQAPGSRS